MNLQKAIMEEDWFKFSAAPPVVPQQSTGSSSSDGINITILGASDKAMSAMQAAQATAVAEATAAVEILLTDSSSSNNISIFISSSSTNNIDWL